MRDKRDLILEFLSKNRNRRFNQMGLKKELFPDQNEDQIKDFLYQIIDYKPNLMKVYKESSIGILPVEYSGLIDDFLLNGGFAKIESDLKSESEFIKNKENLEIDLKQLQKENFEYLKTIRNQESRIRKLNEELKFISLIKQYWWFITTCIGLGWLLGEVL